MNKDKIIKDLKERNDKLANQYRLRDIRVIHLEMENKKLQQENKQLKEEANDYKSRCEFAIELMDTYGCYNDILEIKLYNCLRGEDDE